MEEINMINEIESIFSKSEISLEDISDLQMMDIYYEGKVTDFLKGSYDKAKKIVSAIYNKIKSIVTKLIDSKVIKAIEKKLQSIRAFILSKLKSSKNATESIDLFGTEAKSSVDASVLEAINHIISIIVAFGLAHGFGGANRVISKSTGTERVKTGAIIGLFCGLIFAIPTLVISKILALMMLVGIIGISTYMVVSTPTSEATWNANFMTYTILYGYFDGILKHSSIKRISGYVSEYIQYNMSVFSKHNNEVIAKRMIDNVIKKDDWVSVSDINIKLNKNTNVASNVNRAAQNQILDMKNKVKEYAMSNIDELVKYDFDYSHGDVYGNGVIEKQCKLIDSLIKYINTKTKTGETFKFIMNDIYRSSDNPDGDAEPLD